MTTRGRKGEKQLEILNFIYKQAKKKGYPPTVREMGKVTAIFTSSFTDIY